MKMADPTFMCLFTRSGQCCKIVAHKIWKGEACDCFLIATEDCTDEAAVFETDKITHLGTPFLIYIYLSDWCSILYCVLKSSRWFYSINKLLSASQADKSKTVTAYGSDPQCPTVYPRAKADSYKSGSHLLHSMGQEWTPHLKKPSKHLIESLDLAISFGVIYRMSSCCHKWIVKKKKNLSLIIALGREHNLLILLK